VAPGVRIPPSPPNQSGPSEILRGIPRYVKRGRDLDIPFPGRMNTAHVGVLTCARLRLGGWVRVSVKVSLLACLLILTRTATSAAASAAGVEGVPDGQLSLPQGVGWEDWQAVREQHADHATVRVFVRKGETPATAKVRLVLIQRPAPASASPQAILDVVVQTAKQQCRKVSANSLSKSATDLIYELRGFGCAGQQGERYLLQRIAFIGQWELEVTYAPMTPTNELPPPEKKQAIKLLSSVTISAGPRPVAVSGWFLITPPRQSNGHYDVSAPLSKWKVEEGAGDREKCKGLQALLNSLALKKGQPDDIEEVKNARCVAMDDPRFDKH